MRFTDSLRRISGKRPLTPRRLGLEGNAETAAIKGMLSKAPFRGKSSHLILELADLNVEQLPRPLVGIVDYRTT